MTLLGSSPLVSPEDLQKAVDRACDVVESLNPGLKIDREPLTRALQENLNIFQADSVSLNDDSGHLDWLGEKEDTIEWAFWNRYVRYLRESEELPRLVVERLDASTRRILSKLEDPWRPGMWDRRGMVVGQVQSGKTGNYTGLVCRAADAGYRVIVVLAGMHNSLRSQTQLRLDAGFLGFDTQRRQYLESDHGFAAVALGVGRLVGEARPPVASLTNSSDHGDFGKKSADSLGIMLGQYPVLLVVKKHAGILGNLHDWLEAAAGTGEPKRIRELATLVIDDEADNASINTKKIRTPQGEIDPNLDPTNVNRAIRRLLVLFDRRSYVGYTATPFANIYINPDSEHKELGKDLFPSSFIEYLRPPSNYFGPARLLGLGSGEQPLPLFREIADSDTWMPDRHKSFWTPPAPIPESLRKAMRSFVLARAIRLVRGQTEAHNSMLVHVTRFQAVQGIVARQIEDELELIKAGIRHGQDEDGPDSEYTKLEILWREDFSNTTVQFDGDEFPPVTWGQVEAELVRSVSPIEVRRINGEARDALEYFEHRKNGLNVIAVGGDKLSRGLTLEGLTVSYYLRASRTFDTLLQMGRWFGFRNHYEDACRLYTSAALWDAYTKVSEANEELIAELEEMAARGKTPDDYGLRVRNSVQGMLVTAANKMQAGQKLKIGFAGTSSETVVLPTDWDTASHNLDTLESFVVAIKATEGTQREEERRSGNRVWTGVPGELVAAEFFRPFETPDTAWKVNSKVIASYIENRLSNAELVMWTVALISNTNVQETERCPLGGELIGLTTRNAVPLRREKIWTEGQYSIRRILNPPDEWIDFSPQEVRELTNKTRESWKLNPGRREVEPTEPSGPVVRRSRPPEKGLLLLYPLEPVPEESRDKAVSGLEIFDGPLVGFCASFPASVNAPAMEYTVNVRFLEDLFGASRDDDSEDSL
jgi:hypothetical protein